jgi:hydroxylamine dehydrogenase
MRGDLPIASPTSAPVTPKDCARCHAREHQEYAHSHHAKAGEILASLENILAEKAAGMTGNIADAGHGTARA